jgi:hypothetical protein
LLVEPAECCPVIEMGIEDNTFFSTKKIKGGMVMDKPAVPI